jgi:hypothetical protein
LGAFGIDLSFSAFDPSNNDSSVNEVADPSGADVCRRT